MNDDPDGTRSQDSTPERQRAARKVVVGILVDRGSALVARRRPGTHLEGQWEFPGGKMRPGETPEEALGREFHEEVGIGFESARRLCDVEHHYPDRTVQLAFYICRGPRGEPRGREGQQLRWVTADELERLPSPEANRGVIRTLRDLLSREESVG